MNNQCGHFISCLPIWALKMVTCAHVTTVSRGFGKLQYYLVDCDDVRDFFFLLILFDLSNLITINKELHVRGKMIVKCKVNHVPVENSNWYWNLEPEKVLPLVWFSVINNMSLLFKKRRRLFPICTGEIILNWILEMWTIGFPMGYHWWWCRSNKNIQACRDSRQ